MDTAASTTLPPLKAVTDTDQGGILAITASLGLVFGVISLLIRTYVRIECRATFGKDDYSAFASMVVTLVQSVVVFLAISKGFGKIESDLTATGILTWERDIFVGDLLFLVGMWLTKSSIALLLMRLSRDPSHGVMARLLLAASAIYFVVSVFVVSLRCDMSQPWNADVAGCATSTYVRWVAVTVMDVVTEVALFIGGIWLIRDLQLPWSKKSVVVIAYGLRLPVAVVAVVRLYYVHQSLYSDDLSLHGIPAAVCMQTELAYAVIATTMPCLKPFMSALNTNYGGGATFVLTQTSQNSSGLQRSRDTGNGNGVSSFGTSSAKAVKAKAKAVMSGALGGSGNKSGNKGSLGGTLNSSKARKSTESETRILESKNQQQQHGHGHGHGGSDSDESNQTTSPSASPVRPTKMTTITSAKSPFSGRAGTHSPTGVAVTTDIFVTEEKDPEAAAASRSPTSPALPSFPDCPPNSGRIGHAK